VAGSEVFLMQSPNAPQMLLEGLAEAFGQTGTGVLLLGQSIRDKLRKGEICQIEKKA
jgi:hypothetical protein